MRESWDTLKTLLHTDMVTSQDRNDEWLNQEKEFGLFSCVIQPEQAYKIQ